VNPVVDGSSEIDPEPTLVVDPDFASFERLG